MKKRLVLSFSVMAILLLVVWSGASLALPAFDPSTAPSPPEYSKKSSWLARPSGEPLHDVDVFWVYPTVLYGDTSWLMDVEDPKNHSAAQKTIKQQASVFTGYANLYAPMYRQMNMAGLSLDPEQQKQLMCFGKDDVRRAFQYYLKHDNNGRPFILASHSQGSNVLVDIMVDAWGGLGVENELVAGYLIGWSITDQDLKRNPTLRICQNATQTGCFITYNSIAPGMQDKAPTILPGTVVVNPLTWSTDTVLAPATLNMGAVFYTENDNVVTYPGFASAQVQGSGLVVIPVDPSLVQSNGSVMPEGVYHQYDYSLFYENLRANGMERLRAFRGGGS